MRSPTTPLTPPPPPPPSPPPPPCFADHAYWCFHTLLVKRKWFTLKEING